MNTIQLKKQGGAAMLEAMIAVILLAIGLLGTVGMQARSYAAISDAGLRAEATIAADRLVGIMNNDLAHLAQYAVSKSANSGANDVLKPWLKETTDAIPGATVEVALTPGAGQTLVEIEISWARRKGDAPHRHYMTTYVMNP